MSETVSTFEMPVGLPRPIVDNKPVPWSARAIGTEDGTVVDVDWSIAEPERKEQVRTENKCGVCGETVGPECAVIAREHDRAATDKMIMHLRCAKMALRHCPHFTRHELLVGPREGLYWGHDGHLMMRATGGFREIERRTGSEIEKIEDVREIADAA